MNVVAIGYVPPWTIERIDYQVEFVHDNWLIRYCILGLTFFFMALTFIL
jgi:hypothetical protein